MAAARKKRKDKKSSINKQTTSDVKEEPEGKELHCDHENIVKCSLCQKICQRAVRVNCCMSKACRGCAIKRITATRSCWGCHRPGMCSTDVINWEALRKAATEFKNRGQISSSTLEALDTTVGENKGETDGSAVIQTPARDHPEEAEVGKKRPRSPKVVELPRAKRYKPSDEDLEVINVGRTGGMAKEKEEGKFLRTVSEVELYSCGSNLVLVELSGGMQRGCKFLEARLTPEFASAFGCSRVPAGRELPSILISRHEKLKLDRKKSATCPVVWLQDKPHAVINLFVFISPAETAKLKSVVIPRSLRIATYRAKKEDCRSPTAPLEASVTVSKSVRVIIGQPTLVHVRLVLPKGNDVELTERMYCVIQDFFYDNRLILLTKILIVKLVSQRREEEQDDEGRKILTASIVLKTSRGQPSLVLEAGDILCLASTVDDTNIGGALFSSLDQNPIEQSFQSKDHDVGVRRPRDMAVTGWLAEVKKLAGNQLFRKFNFFDLALRQYSDAVSLCPHVAVYYGNRSACLKMLDRPEEALANSIRSVELSPTYQVGWERLARCYIIFGELTKSREALAKTGKRRGIELDTIKALEQEEAKLDKALSKGRLNDALTHSDWILQESSRCERVLIKKAECLVRLGRSDKAVDVLDKLQNRNADVFYLRAQISYKQADTDEATTFFREALNYDPEHTRAADSLKKLESYMSYKESGNRVYKEGNYDQAFILYTQAMKIDPDNHLLLAKLYFNRANCNYKLKKIQDCVADCTRAIELDGTYVKAYLRRAVAYHDMESYEQCVSDHEKLCQLDPRNLGYAKQLEEARERLKKRKACTHYDILGVANSATAAEIRAAYKKLAVTHHPDKHHSVGDDQMAFHEKKFKEISEAYKVLNDPEKKWQYDFKLQRQAFNQHAAKRLGTMLVPRPSTGQSTSYSAYWYNLGQYCNT